MLTPYTLFCFFFSFQGTFMPSPISPSPKKKKKKAAIIPILKIRKLAKSL